MYSLGADTVSESSNGAARVLIQFQHVSFGLVDLLQGEFCLKFVCFQFGDVTGVPFLNIFRCYTI